MAETPNHPFVDQSMYREVENAVSVEPDVTCNHCKRELNNPYQLCCMHSVCKSCLPNMVGEDRFLRCSRCGDASTLWNDGVVYDPVCRADNERCVSVPNGLLARYIEGCRKAKMLQSTTIPCGNKTCVSTREPSIVFCQECSMYLCRQCRDSHKTMAAIIGAHTMKAVDNLRSLSAQDQQLFFSQNTTPDTCPQHNGEVFKYCCRQCNILMCPACTVDHKSSHTPVFLDPSIAQRHTQSVKVTHQTAISRTKYWEQLEEKIQNQIKSTDKKKEAVLREIDETFDDIHQHVDHRKEKLKVRVLAIGQQKKHAFNKALVAVKKQKEISASTQSHLQFLLTSGSSHDVIASKDLVRAQQSILTSKWCQEEFENTVSEAVNFDPTNPDVLLKTIEEFGVIEDGACPVNCTVQPKPETVQFDGSESITLTLCSFDSKNIRCTTGGEHIEAFLRPKSPIPGPAIKARVVDDENGQYSLSFLAVYLEECTLSISVNGRGILGSPFAMNLSCVNTDQESVDRTSSTHLAAPLLSTTPLSSAVSTVSLTSSNRAHMTTATTEVHTGTVTMGSEVRPLPTSTGHPPVSTRQPLKPEVAVSRTVPGGSRGPLDSVQPLGVELTPTVDSLLLHTTAPGTLSMTSRPKVTPTVDSLLLPHHYHHHLPIHTSAGYGDIDISQILASVGVSSSSSVRDSSQPPVGGGPKVSDVPYMDEIGDLDPSTLQVMKKTGLCQMTGITLNCAIGSATLSASSEQGLDDMRNIFITSYSELHPVLVREVRFNTLDDTDLLQSYAAECDNKYKSTAFWMDRKNKTLRIASKKETELERAYKQLSTQVAAHQVERHKFFGDHYLSKAERQLTGTTGPSAVTTATAPPTSTHPTHMAPPKLTHPAHMAPPTSTHATLNRPTLGGSHVPRSSQKDKSPYSEEGELTSMSVMLVCIICLWLVLCSHTLKHVSCTLYISLSIASVCHLCGFTSALLLIFICAYYNYLLSISSPSNVAKRR